jgi:hypothetical protein
MVNHIKNNLSFILLALGAVSLFIINLVLKNILNGHDYGRYSLFMTWISTIVSFGFLGLDHVILRLAKIKDGVIFLGRSVFIAACIVSIVTTFFASTLMKFTAMKDVEWYELFIIVLTINVVGFVSNLLRIQAKYTISLLLSNGWKIVLLPMICFAIFIVGSMSFRMVMGLVTCILIASLMAGLVIFFRLRIDYIQTVERYVMLMLGFIISLGLITYLNFFDRFVIQAKVGVEAVGNYFYLQNFFSYPANLLGSYVGFKDLVLFKHHGTLALVHQRIRKAVFVGSVFMFFMMLAFWLSRHYGLGSKLARNDLSVIVVLSITSLVRLAYAVLSSLMGAAGGATSILRSNLVSGLFVLSGSSFLYFAKVSTFTIVLFFGFFWIIRMTIFYVEIRRFVNE